MSSEDKYMLGDAPEISNKEMDRLEDLLGKLTKESDKDGDAEDSMFPHHYKKVKKRRGYTDDSSIPSHSRTTEYMIMSDFDKRDTAALLANIGQLISNNNWELMDLDVVNQSFDEIIVALKVIRRYRALSSSAQGILTYDREAFYVGESAFQTLNEVEKALNNKAFL